MSKKIVSLILCLTLVFGTFAVGGAGITAFAESAAETQEGNPEETAAEPGVNDISGLIESVVLPEDFAPAFLMVFDSEYFYGANAGIYFPEMITINFKGGIVADVLNEFEFNLLDLLADPYFYGTFRMPGESEDVHHVVYARYTYDGVDDINFRVFLDDCEIYSEEAIGLSMLPLDLLTLSVRIILLLRSDNAEFSAETFELIKSELKAFGEHRKNMIENNYQFIPSFSKVLMKMLFSGTAFADIFARVKEAA